MGRKNRKGRTSKQNPRRFYRDKRQGRGADEEELFGGAGGGGDEWSARGRRKRRRRRSGAVDAVEAVMDAARRHDRRELAPEPEPGPLWLVDAAQVRSLPQPAGTAPAATSTPAKAAICGNCREWLPPADPHASERGRCLHPASGISYPPSEYEACPFFA